MRDRQGERSSGILWNRRESGPGLRNQDRRLPVDVVDDFGRQWTASEIASSPHVVEVLDGLDDLDGPSSFSRRERVIEVVYACSRRMSVRPW
jgi:hypothetical protein